jgi:hypothetical protein
MPTSTRAAALAMVHKLHCERVRAAYASASTSSGRSTITSL